MYDNPVDEIIEAVNKGQTWAKVRSAFKIPNSNKFPHSSTAKTTFATAEMARKACTSLLLFQISVSHHQVHQETYTPGNEAALHGCLPPSRRVHQML